MRRRCRVGCSFAGKIVRVSANPHLANAGVDFIVRSPPPASSPSVERVPGWARSVGWYHTSDSRTIARRASGTTVQILERGALELLDRDRRIAVGVSSRAIFHRFDAQIYVGDSLNLGDRDAAVGVAVALAAADATRRR